MFSVHSTHPEDNIEEKEAAFDTAIARQALTRSHVGAVPEAQMPVACALISNTKSSNFRDTNNHN